MEDVPTLKGTVSLSHWPEDREERAWEKQILAGSKICLSPHPVTMLLVTKA